MNTHSMTAHRPGKKRETREIVRQVSSYASVGLEMGLSVGVCVWAGQYCDTKFGTAPGFVLGGLVLGLLVSGRILYGVAKRAIKEQDP